MGRAVDRARRVVQVGQRSDAIFIAAQNRSRLRLAAGVAPGER
jgi:hypothetical protein